MGDPDAKQGDDEPQAPPESGVGVISDALISEIRRDRHAFVERFGNLLRNFEADGKPHPHYESSASYDEKTDDVVLVHREDGPSRIRYERFRRGLGKVINRLAAEEIAIFRDFLAKWGI